MYQRDDNILPDSEFLKGHLSFLVVGNRGRMLDARRTPIQINSCHFERGLFRLEILNFEDKGAIWEIPVEEVSRFQFEKDSKCLVPSEVKLIESLLQPFLEEVQIDAHHLDKYKTNLKIDELKPTTSRWLEEESEFFKSNQQLNTTDLTGSVELRRDCINYLAQYHLEEIDHEVAAQWVSQNGGELIKLLQINMARSGLVDYQGQIVRDGQLLNDMGGQKVIQDYILHRLAFVRSFFEKLKLTHLTLYRGMSSEHGWRPPKKSWSSWTPLLKVANHHADFEDFGQHQGQSKDSYLFKRTFSIDKVFMTYFETEGFNQQWKETEVLIMHERDDRRYI